jgi:hypothetical protein
VLDGHPTIKRLFKEFWLPFLVAAAWTTYSLYSTSRQVTLARVIEIFAPAFFLLSWLSGQIVRVRKQAAVEGSLSKVESRLEAVVSRLETQSQEFRGFTIGEGAVLRMEPTISQRPFVGLSLFNLSNYPAFDIHLRLIDLDEPIDPANNKFWTDYNQEIAHLYPKKLVMNVYLLDISVRKLVRVNIFGMSRSVHFAYQVRFFTTESGELLIALLGESNGETINMSVPETFPGYNPENPRAVFGQPPEGLAEKKPAPGLVRVP